MDAEGKVLITGIIAIAIVIICGFIYNTIDAPYHAYQLCLEKGQGACTQPGIDSSVPDQVHSLPISPED